MYRRHMQFYTKQYYILDTVDIFDISAKEYSFKGA